jgi:hypothetical protein
MRNAVEAAMQQAPVTPQEVMAWIRDSLGDGQGRFEVQDLTFIKKSVKVVTPRRDSCFELEAARWDLLQDPAGRTALTEDLRSWARRCLPVA